MLVGLREAAVSGAPCRLYTAFVSVAFLGPPYFFVRLALVPLHRYPIASLDKCLIVGSDTIELSTGYLGLVISQRAISSPGLRFDSGSRFSFLHLGGLGDLSLLRV